MHIVHKNIPNTIAIPIYPNMLNITISIIANIEIKINSNQNSPVSTTDIDLLHTSFKYCKIPEKDRTQFE
ncbi:MAG: hypothetical protein Satyrvirus2_20 [Satyrvirus sp.]|uniref:Uncharacterized protein n=1 Tax=Satyrvirus sp. TaxID=2487771 RepID=A0A3G5AHX6_9VIRU|nr:MAG: hypothetical protein Satyrvirus2_20 [Satyrvirus sp.]